MQLSPIVIAPIISMLGLANTMQELEGLSIFTAFTLGFLIMVWLLMPTIKERHQIEGRASTGQTALWSFLGIFIAFGAQYVAILIQMTALGIEPGSENTDMIVEMAIAAPLLIIAVAVIGPIVEEIVFRQVIFGSLYQRFGFWISAAISALIFAVIHMDFEHLLVYFAMGVAFSFLYVKTKRIIVPIIAHVGINSFVMLVQVVFRDHIEDLEKQLDQLEEMQAFIGGFFL